MSRKKIIKSRGIESITDAKRLLPAPQPAGKEKRQLPSGGKPAQPAQQGPAKSQTDEQAVVVKEKGDASRKFPIVGIGASAGGLEALKELFSHMPTNTGLGFVVVTHQHPGHASLLPDLLGKITTIAVAPAGDGVKILPDRIYVAPPGALISISGGILHLAPDMQVTVPHLPIDYFFRSLAVDQREHAICIVLSGTGTDGTLGMRAIKAESGMAMVQEPPSARYAGMPSSASGTGLADYVLPAPDMPRQLMAYVKGLYLKPRSSAPAAAAAGEFPQQPLRRILALLNSRTGHDFMCYKSSTIRRRIERRMNIHQIKQPAEYVRFLQENPHELDMLFDELLISVTSFFRDSEAFKALANKPLPELLQSRSGTHSLRVWVPGCASGEEAYSVAMLIQECMEKQQLRLEVNIFGTDLDVHAIETARAGLYGGGIATDISRERLDRFFTREDNIYRVRKEIREMLVFAPQSIVKDPPFTKLDMIVCRNVLIYLEADMQRKLLPLFHYALQPDGLLFLGPSENISGFKDLFDIVDGKWKIYRRRPVAPSAHPIINMGFGERGILDDQPVMPSEPRATGTSAQVQRLLLGRFAPASAVVNERGDVVYIHGRTGSFLEPTEGQPRNNILDMAREGLRQPLIGALHRAATEKKDIIREEVRVRSNGGYTTVNLHISYIQEPEALQGLLLVTFHTIAALRKGAAKDKQPKAREATRIRELERELQYNKESLQTTIEELETSNEELKSTNEELQSTNEELQSTNEELETSKEELQSLNEELTTVNSELQSKLDELAQANADIQNLLNNTQVATIFLDDRLRVKRYTEQAKQMIRLIQSDLGRPLSDITSNLEYDRLDADCHEVLRTLSAKDVNVVSMSGQHWQMRIMPCRTPDNVIDGVVITFTACRPGLEPSGDAKGVQS